MPTGDNKQVKDKTTLVLCNIRSIKTESLTDVTR